MTTISWESAVSGDWNDASNWTPNTVPGPGDDVAITAIAPFGASPPDWRVTQFPYAISLSLTTTIRSLTLDGQGAVLDANDAHLTVRKAFVNGEDNIVDIENRSVVLLRTYLVNDGLLELDNAIGSHSSRLTVDGNVVNDGQIEIAADGSDNGRSSITVAGTLINRGLIDIGGVSMDRSVSVVAGAYRATGGLTLVGAQGYDASLIVGAAAPTVLQSSIWLGGDAQLQFTGGAITRIGPAGGIALFGPDAEIVIAGRSGDTSALTGLTLDNGQFILSDGASFATAGGVDFRNNGALDIGAVSVPGGDPTLMSIVSIGGNLINNEITTVGYAPSLGDLVADGLEGGNATLAVAGTITNHGLFGLTDPSGTSPVSVTANAVFNNELIGIEGGTFTVAADLRNFAEIYVGEWFPPVGSPFLTGSSNLTVDGTFANLGGEFGVGSPYITAPVTASLGALINHGFVSVSGANGEAASLTVTGTTNNKGTIFASDGGAALLGKVNGGGTAEIGSDGMIEFGGASNNAVSFDDGTGTLKLDSAQSFIGTVADLTQGDEIDLANFEFGNGPVITVISGSGKADTYTRVTIADGPLSVTLRLLNSYAGEFAVNASAYSLTADTGATHPGTSFQLAASVV